MLRNNQNRVQRAHATDVECLEAPDAIEAALPDMVGTDVELAERPLARDRGGVSLLLHEVRESDFRRLAAAPGFGETHHALVARDARPEGISTGENARPRRTAQGHGESVVETHALRCQRVDTRRFIRRSTVGADAFGPQVIYHDQNDVWLS